MATSKNVIAAAAVVLRSEGAMEVVREINRVNKELNEMKRDANRAASAMKTLGRAGKGDANKGGLFRAPRTRPGSCRKLPASCWRPAAGC